ncbi:TAP42-like protein [Umbelopsis sp. PMI_123]|nr:TAP42-like protein [Umbelopsis sp. PMI_123]
MESLSLSELFNRGQGVFLSLRESKLASADPQFQSQVEQGIAYLERASDLVQRLGIFSENEILEDINANDLRFLLVNAYLGGLQLQRTGGNRKEILDSAKKYLLDFLHTCEIHQIISSADAKLFKRFQDANATPNMNVATSREQKIERYKREKEIEGKIKELQAILEKSNDTTGQGDVDVEDIERDLVMTLVQYQILKSLEHLQSIEQEYVMVLEMEKMRERAARGETSDLRSPQPRIDPRNATGPLLSNTGAPLRPFIITSKRQELKDQVFRPGWALPTMTIDEYLQQEEERGNIIKGGGKEPEKPEIDDNNYEALDAETMKARDWDEYKEDNPRGWGNRGNKG